jgi:hypothetical protein
MIHVNVSRGGFFSIFDKVHYIDPRTLRPVVITKDAPTGKCQKLRNQRNNLENTEELEDLNRVWMIVRYMKACSKDDS